MFFESIIKIVHNTADAMAIKRENIVLFFKSMLLFELYLNLSHIDYIKKAVI